MNSLNIGESGNVSPENIPDKSQAIWLDRINMYGMLRLIFSQGPGFELFSDIRELRMLSPEANLARFNTELAALQKTIRDKSKSDVVEYQTEFTRLFIGPGKAPAYPYECAYRTPHGLMMQEITSDVRKFYLEKGLVMQRLNAIPDDHLGAELEFFLYMSQQMLEQPEKAITFAETQREFMQKHILSWLDDFVADILANTDNPFFTHLASLLRAFVHWDEDYLVEIISA
jgi:TorA maturation chaperone TorD